jgi:nitrous oxidase accessory protein
MNTLACVLGGVARATLVMASVGGALSSASARTLVIPARAGAAAEAQRVAQDGDTLVLARGLHAGPIVVDRALVLRGERGAIVDGGGRGSVVQVRASGARVEGLIVQNSGARVITVDAGIAVTQASNVVVRDVTVRNVLYGVYGARAPRLRLIDSRLAGRVTPGDELGEGNGLHVWYCDSVRVERCTIERFVDNVYLSFAKSALVDQCLLQDCGRYGLHTMYCQRMHLAGSTFTRTVAGCAIMFSNRMRVERCAFLHNRGPRTYGLLLRDCSDGTFSNNTFVDNTIAMFLDNSNRNRITHNLVQDNGWGVLLFSSCSSDTFAANAIINNDYPVALDMRYTDNAFDDGRTGNFWSENAAYDLDADGVSDAPYAPVSAFAFLSKQYPDLAVLSKSPVVAALGVAERVFPSLRPSEAVDRVPLVRPARARASDRAPVAPLAPRSRPRVAWPAAAGFGALAAATCAGVVRVRGLR